MAEIGQCREILLRHLWRRGQDGKAAATACSVRFPVGFPLDLDISLRPRLELEGVVLASGGSEGLDRKPVLSRREIVEKRGPLRNLTDGRAIRVNYRLRCINIAPCRIRLPEEPHSSHPGSDRWRLRLGGGHICLWGAPDKRKQAERAEPHPHEMPCRHLVTSLSNCVATALRHIRTETTVARISAGVARRLKCIL